MRAPDIAFLQQYGSTYGFSLGRPASINVAPADDTVFFLRSPARSFTRDLYSLEVATGRESVLLTAERLLDGGAEELSAEERSRRERQRQVAAGFASYELSRDGKRLLVPLSGRLFVLDREDGRPRHRAGERGRLPHRSASVSGRHRRSLAYAMATSGSSTSRRVPSTG